MRYKALVLVDALLAKMSSTTSIAMDWLHNLQRLHQLQRQLLFRHLHQLLLLHQLPWPHLRQHRLRLLRHALQLHKVIANK